MYLQSLLIFWALLCGQVVSIAQSSVNHNKINKDLYEAFSSSYINSDYELFKSIHSIDIVRINHWNGIRTSSQYLGEPGKSWTSPDRSKRTIDFRLSERIASESHVSDRGIYRVVYDPGTSGERVTYGKFHLLARIEDGVWKIIVDYDEPATQNEYSEAYNLRDSDSYYNPR